MSSTWTLLCMHESNPIRRPTNHPHTPHWMEYLGLFMTASFLLLFPTAAATGSPDGNMPRRRLTPGGVNLLCCWWDRPFIIGFKCAPRWHRESPLTPGCTARPALLLLNGMKRLNESVVDGRSGIYRNSARLMAHRLVPRVSERAMAREPIILRWSAKSKYALWN